MLHKKVISVTAGNFSVAGLGFLWNIALLRFCGVGVTEMFYLFQTYFALITSVISFGVPAVIMRWQINIRKNSDFLIVDIRYIWLTTTMAITFIIISFWQESYIWIMSVPVAMLEIIFIINSNSLILFNNKNYYLIYILSRQITQFVFFGMFLICFELIQLNLVIIAMIFGYVFPMILILGLVRKKNISLYSFYKNNKSFTTGMAIKNIAGPFSSMLERQFIAYNLSSDLFVTLVFIQKCYDGLRMLFESAEKILMRNFFVSIEDNLNHRGAFTSYVGSISIYAWITLIATPLLIYIIPIIYINLPGIKVFAVLVSLYSIVSVYASGCFLLAFKSKNVLKLVLYNSMPLVVIPLALIPINIVPIVQQYLLLYSVTWIAIIGFTFYNNLVEASYRIWFVLAMPIFIILGIYVQNL